MMNSTRHQRGFAAIAAVFIIVALAGLGAFMVSMSNSQQLGSAQDLMGTRAYWAARSGLDWGIAKVTAAPTVCFSSNPTSPPLAIDGFSVKVTCAVNSYAESTKTVLIFHFISEASSGSPGSATYVERRLYGSMEKP